jgi:dTDP-glucose 4,6-dehydratase
MTKSFSSATRTDCIRSIGDGAPSLAALQGGRIVITGGTGFLGTWLVEIIAALNDDFGMRSSVKLYSRNPRAWAQLAPHLAARKDVECAPIDVRAPFEFPSDATHIIHAAGIPDNRAHSSDPLRVFDTGVMGTQHALDAASKLEGLAKFLLVSSGLVARMPAGGAAVEDDFLAFDPNTPHAVYIESKRAAESLSATYRSQFRIPVTLLRPFTLIGPYQLPDKPWAINNFIRDALAGGTIRMQGDGSPRRSFLYGSDAAFWTLSVLAHGSVARSYNLGGGTPYSLKDAAELVAQAVGPHVRISYGTVARDQFRPADFFPDLTRIVSELGVEEHFTLFEAIDSTIRWQKALAAESAKVS